jgi:hypothetical protein
MEELNVNNVENNQVADTTNKDLKGRIIAAVVGLAVGVSSTIAATKIGERIAKKKYERDLAAAKAEEEEKTAE